MFFFKKLEKNPAVDRERKVRNKAFLAVISLVIAVVEVKSIV